MKFGFAIPQISPARAPEADFLRAFLQRADGLGLHSLWVQEQILGSAPSYEPVTLLSFAAALTQNVRLGSAVLLSALRSPVHLAKSLSTIDHVSRGRLIVGLGLGGNAGLYPAYGLSPARRARRFREGILLLKKLWTEPRVTYQGEFWTLRDAAMEPKPVQQPHPPIWIGAHHPSAIERAVRLGTGWIAAGSSSVDTLRAEIQILRERLARAKVDPGTFTVAKRAYLAVDADKGRAERRLMEWFARYYGSADLAKKVAIYGSEPECAEKLREIAALGVELVILNPVFDELAHLELVAGGFPLRS